MPRDTRTQAPPTCTTHHMEASTEAAGKVKVALVDPMNGGGTYYWTPEQMYAIGQAILDWDSLQILNRRGPRR